MDKTKVKIKLPPRDLKVYMTELRKKDPKVNEFLRTLEEIAWESRTDALTYDESEERWRMIEESCKKTLPELNIFCDNCTKDFESDCREEGTCLHIGDKKEK